MLLGFFFDLEKAYESMWKFGIMRDLHNAGLHGRLTLFIESFLKNRQFHVRLGSSCSDLFGQEMGVPQGSILSVTLFGLKINLPATTLILRHRLPRGGIHPPPGFRVWFQISIV